MIASNSDSGEALFDLSTFDLLFDFLTKGADRRVASKASLENCLFYHVAEPLDLIIQPSFAVHAVITEPTFSRGKRVWALVTGYEAIAKTDPSSIRGRRIINDFCLDVRKGLIAQEMSIRSQLELLRLLKIADYRKKSRKKCERW